MPNGFTEGTPTATIELDKPRVLAFTLGSMRRAKKLGVLNVDAEDPTALMLAMPEYVWACLSDNDRKELSIEAIAELMSPRNVNHIAEAIGELFRASMPEESTSGNGQPAAATEPTAGTSISSSSGELAGTI